MSEQSVPPLPTDTGEPSAEASAALRRRWREAAVAAREALPVAQRATLEPAILRALAQLLEHLTPASLGFCWPWRGEVDLRPLVAGWLAAAPARRAALPVVEAAARAMVFRAWQPGAPMGADRHGIPVPLAGDILQPELLLVPLNAFDARGYRLGYGGGYFDRTLAELRPAPVTVGVGFELGRLPSILPQAHDQPMDWLVTEAGAFRVGEGS